MSNMQGSKFKFILYSAENISGMVFGLIGAAMVARVFGPENMGRLSLVQALSAMLVFIATLGLDHFIVRDFVINRKDGQLKGSILCAQSIGWVLYLASLLVFFILKDQLSHEIYLILSVAVTTYFLRVLYLRAYLQAVNDAAAIAISALVSRVASLIFLVLGSIYGFSYDLMVMYLPLQAIVQALMMYKSYRKYELSKVEAEVSIKRIKSSVSEALPMMFSTAIYFGYSQADILIVSHFMSVKEVGIYSAAMRLVPQAVFLGHVTVMTFYTLLSDQYQTNKSAFLETAIKVARLQFVIAFLLSATVSLLAPLIIWVLYGSKFDSSAHVLSIAAWAWIFTLPACLFTRLMVLGGLAKYDLIKALIVAPVSLGLNILLIPRFGFIAGAYVSVVTYLVGDFLIYALFKDTRFIFNIGVNAIVSVFIHPRLALKETIDLFRLKHE